MAANLPPVIPILRFPDGRLMNDSTPLAYALEREHPGERSIIPDDPAHAYLSDLLEDFGDEWVTKRCSITAGTTRRTALSRGPGSSPRAIR